MLTPNLPAKDKMVDGLIIQGEPDEKKNKTNKPVIMNPDTITGTIKPTFFSP